MGLIQHPDFWQTVAENVQIYREDILELDTHLVRLKNGIEIPTDVLLCGTGWAPDLPYFFTQDQIAQLGLPHRIDQPTEDDPDWTKLENEADHQVVTYFPRLAKPPPYHQKPIINTPHRLYNCMAPLHDDTIVFLGHIYVPNAFRAAECQAIWATAYLDKTIPLPPAEQMRREIPDDRLVQAPVSQQRRRGHLSALRHDRLHGQAAAGAGLVVPPEGMVRGLFRAVHGVGSGRSETRVSCEAEGGGGE